MFTVKKYSRILNILLSCKQAAHGPNASQRGVLFGLHEIRISGSLDIVKIFQFTAVYIISVLQLMLRLFAPAFLTPEYG